MSEYTSATDADRREMLAAIGVARIEDLFADIPARLRLTEPLSLGPGLSEQEVYDELRALAARNASTEDESAAGVSLSVVSFAPGLARDPASRYPM